MLNQLKNSGFNIPKNFKFKSLRSRITIAFLSLILLIQFIGALAIKLSIEKNARVFVEDQLLVGERIFTNILNHNGENLTQACKILATDYGFRQAIGSNDYETIISAISNHQARVNADIAFFYSGLNDKLAISGSIPEQEAKPIIIKLINSAMENGQDRSFTIFKGKPFQLVAVPVKAPITIGWIVMGFEINNTLANKINELSGLDITFISSTNRHDWLVTASTLSATDAHFITQNANRQDSLSDDHKEIMVANINYGSKYVKVFDDQNNSLYAVLQKSIDTVTAPYRMLQINLLILTILGAIVFMFVIYYVSNRITQPITKLALSARELEQGNYEIRLPTDREDELGLLSHAFNSMSDAIDAREKSITKLAFFDDLTELPNRPSFIMQVQKQLAISKQDNQAFSLLVMDLNRFKQVNNILGQLSGNLILQKIAKNLQRSTRSNVDFVARFGGDEFAVFLPNTNAKNALIVATKLALAVEEPIEINEQLVDISAGFGIASYPDHGDTAELLLSRAEMSMYVAKSLNIRASIFESRYDVASSDNLSLASELKNAIQNNHLILYVQPKVRIDNNQINSVEALVRWRDPIKGLIFPDQFIPFAEQTGIVREITLWMIKEAVSYCAAWKKQGHEIAVAVNISARDLIDHDLPNKITHILKNHQLDVSAITLEITESSIMDDPTRSILTLDNLHQIGIKLAIDDFGTGHSSLAYIKSLPVQALKIDKSFVFKIEESNNDRIIVQSTIALGHNLGLEIIAEGVENAQVLQELKSMKCDYAQGYHVSKPMPANEFMTWLNNWGKETV